MRLVVYFYVFLYDYTSQSPVIVDKINVLCVKSVLLWAKKQCLVMNYDIKERLFFPSLEMTCRRSAHVVRMLCTDGAKHWHMVNIGAWSVLSILVSRIHKHTNRKRGDFLA